MWRWPPRILRSPRLPQWLYDAGIEHERSARIAVTGRLPFRFGVALVVAGLAAAAASFLAGASWPLLGSRAADPQPAAPSIPVIAGKTVRADTPVYLTGLGSAQASNSVLVKSRVDGQLVKLGFVEGQNVPPGDVLAETDPVPYETALAPAQAVTL